MRTTLLCLVLVTLLASVAWGLDATWNAATDVPVVSQEYTASGAVNFTLNFAPETGTDLTLIKNSASSFINGTFSNLGQGQVVTLQYNGVNYSFVANYYGGNGNDLVLQWANVRLVLWGRTYSQAPSLPVAVPQVNALADKIVITIATGDNHNLALCADGTITGWGDNSVGQLGNNRGPSYGTVLQSSGPLAGKTVIGIAAAANHSLALASEGTVAEWGEAGLGGTRSNVPVAVRQTSGALSGKVVVALASGSFHTMALCSDGSLAAWGLNASGQLGNKTMVDSNFTAVAVNQAGVLSGKAIVAIATGQTDSLALCSDGTVAMWGANTFGQLGNNTTTRSAEPVLVDQSGVLAGKTVVSVATGAFHNVALCSDGTLATWGFNTSGQLGDNTTINRSVPVLVDQTGVLSGKRVVAVAAGYAHSVALCSNGDVVAWGSDTRGELGDGNTVNSPLPVLVSRSALVAGERFYKVTSSPASYGTLALVAASPVPLIKSLPAKAITATSATLQATVNANANDTTVFFDYGATTDYGTTVAATPSPLGGSQTNPASVTLTGLTSGATYHFRVRGANAAGSVNGNDLLFTTLGNNANLTGLVLSAGTLSPSFSTAITSYNVIVSKEVAAVNVTPTAADANATVKVDGATVVSGNASAAIALSPGNNSLELLVTAPDGSHKTYIVTVRQTTGYDLWASANNLTESNASPAADADHDGLSNLLEFAFGFDPTRPTSPQTLPTPRIVNQNVAVVTFTEPPGVTGITYVAEYSLDLSSPFWFPLLDTGSGTTHTFTHPFGSIPQSFIRLKVEAP